MRAGIELTLSITVALALGCTNLAVATPEQAAALDDLDWSITAPEQPAAPQGESAAPEGVEP